MTFRYVLTFLLLLPNAVLGAAGLTYHGRLIAPTGVPVTSSVVRFRIQVRTPGSEDCLMYEEEQIRDLSQTQGVFELTIGANVAYRRDSTGLPFDRIFSNYGTFNLAGLCGLGSTYTPGYADNRRLEVAFNDGTFAGWEPMPTQAVNYVPTALSALQVGGFTANSLLRVEDGSGPQNVSSMSFAQFTELMSLILGTSTQYMKTSATGAGLPSFASDPSGVTAGQMWYDSAGNVVKFYNGSTVQTLGVSGSGISSLTAGTGLTGGTITTSGTIALATAGTAGTYYQVTTDAYGRVTAGQSSLLETDLPNITTAGKVSGSAITSGTIGGSTAILTSGSIQTTGDVTSRRNVLYDHSGVGPGFVGLQSPADMSGANYTLTFPLGAGTAGQVLSTTDTTGTLAWTNPVATDLSTIVGTGIVQRNGVNSYSTVSVVAPLNYSSGNLGLNAGSGGVLLDGGNTVTGTLSAGTVSNHNVEIKTFNTTRMTIDTSGNVGIGTTNPGQPLQIVGSSADNRIRLGSSAAASSSNFSRIDFAVMSSAQERTAGLITSGLSNINDASREGFLAFETTTSGAVTEKVRIDSSGNVGIGTTSPQAKLDSAGSIIARGLDTATSGKITRVGYDTVNDWGEILSYDVTGAAFKPLRLRGSSVLLAPDGGYVGVGTASPVSNLDVTGPSSVGLSIRTPGNVAGFQSFINFSTKDDGNLLGGAGNLGWQLNARGNAFNGVDDNKFNFAFWNGTSWNNPMTILPDGKVGIGTTLPATALEVNGVVKATSFEGSMISSGATNTGGYTINTDSNSSGGDGGFNFQIRGSTAVQISDAGGLFVNKTPLASESFAVKNASGKGSSIGSQSNDGSVALFVTPNATTQAGLTVRGLASQSAALFQVQDSTPSDKFIVTANGNVGIGTTNPTSKLDVYGANSKNGAVEVVGRYLSNNVTDPLALEIGMGNDITAANRYISLRVNEYNVADRALVLQPMGGNVGIGTIAPIAALDVYSPTPATGVVSRSATALGSASGGGILAMTPNIPTGADQRLGVVGFGAYTNGTTTGFPAAIAGWSGEAFSASSFSSYLTFETAPTSSVRLERMRITGAGKVGIGTNNPSEALEVNGNVKASSFIGGFTNSAGITGAGTIKLATTNTTATAGYNVTNSFGVAYNPASAVAPGTYIYALGNSLVTAGAADMSNARLTSSVSQANHATNSNLFNMVGGYASAQNSGAGTITTAVGAEGYTVNSSSGKILSGLGGSFAVYNETSGEIVDASGVNVEVKNLTGTIQNAYAGGFSVTNSSGTVNTGYGVYIGAVQATNKWSIYASDATVPSYFAGSVGIGTTVPNSKLEVNGAIRVLGGSASDGTNGYMFFGGSGDVDGGMHSPADGVLAFKTNAAEAMRIDPTGKVGIGTTTPTSPLDILGLSNYGHLDLIGNGTDAESAIGFRAVNVAKGAAGNWVMGSNLSGAPGAPLNTFTIWSGAKGNVLNLTAAGNVGIGTTNPGSALDVVGTGIIRNTVSWPTFSLIGQEGAGAYPGALLLQNSRGGAHLQAGDHSGVISFRSTLAGETANIVSRVPANHSGTSTPGELNFRTAPVGGVVPLDRMTIDSNGYVGIGTTFPSANLHVHSDVNPTWGLTQPLLLTTNSNFSSIVLNSGQSSKTLSMHFGANAPAVGNQLRFGILDKVGALWEKNPVVFDLDAPGGSFTVDSAGNLGVGITTPGYKLDVQGGDINASGSVRAGGLALTSDIRYKREIEIIPDALEKILRIRGVSYNWRSQEFPEKHFNDRHQIGVIAQEVEAQFPEVVDTNKDGYKSVNYAALIAPVIEAVKKLYHQVTGVEEKQLRQDREIASLKNDNQLKDQKIQQLENENASIKQWICTKDPKAAICN